MYAQYIAEGAATAPLLLIGEVTPADAAALIAALRPLAVGAQQAVPLHHLAEWSPASTLRVEAVSAERDVGCEPVGIPQTHLRCAVRAVTWDQVIGLLAPFAEPGSGDAHRHQYINEDGPVTWIVSTDSTW